MLRNSAIAQAVTALDERLRREAKRHLFWGKFMGSIKKSENYNNDMVLTPSESPIEVNEMINTPGLGDRMLIPMTMELAGLGRIGDAVMLGHEEDIARKYAMIHYNQLRHGVPLQKGKKEYNVDKILQILEDHVGKLGWWFAQRENWEIVQSLYLGVGEMLSIFPSDPVYGQGLGLDNRIHPNLYYQASGKLTRIGSAGKFPTMAEVYSAINGAAANGQTFTANSLRLARTLAYSKLYLKPIFIHNGQKYWGVVIDPAQADTLRADAMFNAGGAAAPLNYGLNEHPLVTGSIGIYGNFVVFEDPVAVRGYTTLTAAGAAGSPGTDGSINVLGSTAAIYDTTDKQNPRFLPQTGRLTSSSGDGYQNHGAIIIGGSMLGKAMHSPLSFETESFDYNNWKGLAASTMYGYERLDFIPEDQVPTRSESSTTDATGVYNRSSAIITTFQDE